MLGTISWSYPFKSQRKIPVSYLNKPVTTSNCLYYLFLVYNTYFLDIANNLDVEGLVHYTGVLAKSNLARSLDNKLHVVSLMHAHQCLHLMPPAHVWPKCTWQWLHHANYTTHAMIGNSMHVCNTHWSDIICVQTINTSMLLEVSLLQSCTTHYPV